MVQIHDASTLHVDFRLDVKEGDERAGRRGAPDARRARSVRSGRTLKRVAQEEGGERGSA
ncbi:hypothetical protein [Streptomyces sp. NPDC048516]|uniref:hypothetical protein n=1 Tax=Streptomyces sp. NPDC048516 TaxID=3365565 RepID=UPI00371349F1